MNLMSRLLLSAALAFAAAAAFADGSDTRVSASAAAPMPVGAKPRPGIAAACRDDVKALCKDVRPGGGALLNCLKKNEASLSEGCAQAFADAQKKFRNGPCGADTNTFCAGMAPGDGKWGACMESNKEKLSDACKQSITKTSERAQKRMDALKQKAQTACGADAAKLCPGTEPGDGKFGPCLTDHQDQLSDACQAFLSHAGAPATPRSSGAQ